MTTYKNELGRATWNFLDVFFDGYPEKPDEMTEMNMKLFIGFLCQLYPCKDCQPMFEQFVANNKPNTCCKRHLLAWLDRLKKEVKNHINNN